MQEGLGFGDGPHHAVRDVPVASQVGFVRRDGHESRLIQQADMFADRVHQQSGRTLPDHLLRDWRAAGNAVDLAVLQRCQQVGQTAERDDGRVPLGVEAVGCHHHAQSLVRRGAELGDAQLEAP